jgi:GxxExxY protein
MAERLTEQVIGLAIKVHRNTRPGMLEPVCEQCLCFEFSNAGLPYERQVAVPVMYCGQKIGDGFRLRAKIHQADPHTDLTRPAPQHTRHPAPR